MKADELKSQAATWLRARHPGAHIAFELSLAQYGGALVDVAAICDDHIVGVEIKGEGDSTSRLKLQGNMYSRACRSMFLLASPELAVRCRQNKPPGWSIIYATREHAPDYRYMKHCRVSGIVYPGQANGKLFWQDGEGLSPATLAAMVWTTEYKLFEELLLNGGPFPTSLGKLPSRKQSCINFVVSEFPLPQIERAVCGVLRARDWFSKKVETQAESLL